MVKRERTVGGGGGLINIDTSGQVDSHYFPLYTQGTGGYGLVPCINLQGVSMHNDSNVSCKLRITVPSFSCENIFTPRKLMLPYPPPPLPYFSNLNNKDIYHKFSTLQVLNLPHHTQL